ncbi:MAG: hypothetical protein ACO3RU_10390, partial [Planctomycetota bacterium]
GALGAPAAFGWAFGDGGAGSRRSLHGRGDAEGALRATDRALAAGGTSCRLLEVRARAFEALSRDEDALHVLDAASDHRDASPETFRELARHLRRCGEVARARIAESEAAVRAACG